MKNYTFSIIFFVIFNVVYGELVEFNNKTIIYRDKTFIIDQPKPFTILSQSSKQVGKCSLQYPDEIWDYGKDFKPSKSCTVYRCSMDGVITVFNCGGLKLDKNCEIHGRDPTKSFPQCCFEVKCKDEDGEFVFNPFEF